MLCKQIKEIALLLKVGLSGLILTHSPSILWQGAQAVGMGKDSQSVPAAALLFAKANEILGYAARSILDVLSCIPSFKLVKNKFLVLCLIFII
jgi:hypothetical protein